MTTELEVPPFLNQIRLQNYHGEHTERGKTFTPSLLTRKVCQQADTRFALLFRDA